MSKTKAQLEEQIEELEQENSELLDQVEQFGNVTNEKIPEHGHAKNESKAKRQARLVARKSQKPTIHELEAILGEK